MSGQTGFPPPNVPLIDQKGNISLIWRKFFAALFIRTGAALTSANANINGDASQTFAVADATETVHAVNLAQYRSQAGQIPSAQNVGPSPWTFGAPSNGMLMLSGGTITDIEFQRDGTQASLGKNDGCYPLRSADQLIISHSGAPAAIWFPN